FFVSSSRSKSINPKAFPNPSVWLGMGLGYCGWVVSCLFPLLAAGFIPTFAPLSSELRFRVLSPSPRRPGSCVTASGLGDPEVTGSELPLPTPNELLRLELTGVNTQRAAALLVEWGGKRVPDSPDHAGFGVPRTGMPLTSQITELGLKLSFDASPSDTMELEVFPLAKGSSCVIMRRGVGGQAVNGLLGPQLSGLVKGTEDKVRAKLQRDIMRVIKERWATIGEAVTDNGEEETALPETAFPGGKMFENVVDSYEGEARQKVLQDSLEMFETASAMDTQELEGGVKGFEGILQELRSSNATESQLTKLFEAGSDIAKGNQEEDLSLEKELAQLSIALGPDLQGGIDILKGPPASVGGQYTATTAAGGPQEAGEKTKTYTMFDEDGDPVLELTEAEMMSIDEEALEHEIAMVEVLLQELLQAPQELWNRVCGEYRDILLSDYFIISMRARLAKISSEEERQCLSTMTAYATTLMKELAMVKQSLEIQQLEKIRSICQTAMEDMGQLPDKVRQMKPILDQDFVAYLRYAIEQERADIVSSGLDPNREPTTWLQVLGIIQRGVFAELEKDVYLDVKAISYVLRMEEAEQRKKLLDITVSNLPSMDVRNFKKNARNIVEHLEIRNDATPALKEKVAELGTMLEEVLPESRVIELSKEADDWAAQRIKDHEEVRARLQEVDNNQAIQSIAQGSSTDQASTAGMLKSNDREVESQEGMLDVEGELVDIKALYAKYGDEEDCEVDDDIDDD
ncbi:unnamed protein product, partial [Chrysoparadoxa australica]